jgi:hypothetical protein
VRVLDVVHAYPHPSLSQRARVSDRQFMKKTLLLLLVVTTFLLIIDLTQAQPGKVPWIGYLAAESGSSPQAFVQGLRDLGYMSPMSGG